MRVLSVLGPSQSGKTTLVEAMAGLEESHEKPLDIEGVASARKFRFMDEDWAAFDIVGGADNLAQLGPALAASDAAVLCVPADAEAAVLCAPYLRIIEEAGIPCILFINRIDAATHRVSEIVSALQTYCAHHIVLRQVPLRDGDRVVGAVDLISERAWEYHEGRPSTLIEIPESMQSREREARTELLEAYADFDDSMLEELIEDKEPMAEEVYEVAARVLQHHDMVPALLGSALHRNGITRLMKALRHEAPGVEVACERLGARGGVVAVGGLADVVKHLGKTVLVRCLDGEVSAGSPLGGESVGSITDMNGKTQIASLKAGEIGLTVKTDHLNLGQFYTKDGGTVLPGWAQPRPPAFRRIVTPQNERDEARLSTALERLREIEPGLSVEQDEQSGHAVLGTQGPLHLRRLIQKLTEGFGIEVEQSNVLPALRETVTKPVENHHRHRKQSGGAGQFADVLIELRPEPRGSGFRFEEQIKGGAVPRNYIPAVEAGARDALLQGPGGFPVTDVSVVLKDGKHHAVDSSDFAFRTAGKNAVREALAQARPVILQPIMRTQIHVPSIFAGGLVPIVSSLKGQVLGFENNPDAAGWDIFNTLLPIAAQDDLFNALGSATRGTAWFTSEFDHYQEARADELAGLQAARTA
ncbi:elongation factor G [Ostreiculturibacter nitratireducens]|uniref:elongation factor G n=1 Tax=Ostreiculturibacter nitratireducens TaxID=3075226 RepID=UPI0031B5BC6D